MGTVLDEEVIQSRQMHSLNALAGIDAASLARPATPGRAGAGPREVCADYEAIGHVLLAVLHQVRSSLQAVAKHRPSALRLS